MGNMDTRFKHEKMYEVNEQREGGGLRFRTFHVVIPLFGLNPEKTEEIGRVTVAYWGRFGAFGEGQVYECAFSFCAGVDLSVFDRQEGEVRAYCRLTGEGSSSRAVHQFTRDNGKLKDQFKPLILKEAERRNVPWMKGIKIEDLK